MKIAYLDTSVVVALAFGEPESRPLVTLLKRYDRLLSSNLLEAEFRSALLREGISGENELSAPEPGALGGVDWILPDRPLTREISRICRIGYLLGADLWHLACALFVSPDPSQMAFLSLDVRQTEVAARLGFQSVPPPPSISGADRS